MAMGLGFLGRGKAWRILYVGLIHVMGAAFGGAIVGIVLGVFGSLLLHSSWQSVIIAVTAIFAFLQQLTRHPRTLGLHRQVPRMWARTLPPIPRFFLWGILLGSGVAIVIPYSAFLLVLATQLTSGIILGSLSGAIFGSTRAIVALLPLLSKGGRLYPEKLLLPAVSKQLRWLNILLIIVGGFLLVVGSWH